MNAEILINIGLHQTRIAKLENGQVVEAHFENDAGRGFSGNIYKGRVERVLPGMQAAFVNIGLDRTAFLYVKNILGYYEKAKTSQEWRDKNDSDEANSTSEDNDADDFNAHQENLPSISELIKEGDIILAQVIKEPMGTKGAQITCHISIPGRFLVYLPNNQHIGISHRIENSEERDRLRSIVEKNLPSTKGGFIIRTVAEGATTKHLKDDMDYLIKQWSHIKKTTDKQKKTGLSYQDLDLATKLIRDRVTDDVSRIVIDDLGKYKKISKFVQNFLPKFKKKVELYSDTTPLFEQNNVESELNRALDRQVWLKSGGYIVFDQTEALTSIDVNTGRFVGKRNLEETIVQTNLEAVKEIAYQIRLRNIGGILILDFIDMKKPEDRERVFKAFTEEIEKDPVKSNIYPISELGLVEMSRKRTKESLLQQQTIACPSCEGKGYIKSFGCIFNEIIRECIRENATAASQESLMLYCHPDLAKYIAKNEVESIHELENNLGTKIHVKGDRELHLEDYEIFTKGA